VVTIHQKPFMDVFYLKIFFFQTALKTPNTQNLSRISSKSFNISQRSANRLSIKEENEEDLDEKKEVTNTSQILSATPIRSSRKSSNLFKLTANKSLNASLSSRILHSPRISSLTKKRSSGLQLESTLNDIKEDNESRDNSMQAINEESVENSEINKMRSSLNSVNITPKQSLNASFNSKVVNSGRISTLKKSRISKVSLKSTPNNSLAVNGLENQLLLSTSLRSCPDPRLESSHKLVNTTPFNSTSAKRSAHKKSRLLSVITDSSDISGISPQSLRLSVSSTTATNNSAANHLSSISTRSFNQISSTPERDGSRRKSSLRTNGNY